MFADLGASSVWWFWSSLLLLLGTSWQFYLAWRDLQEDEIKDKRLDLAIRQQQLSNHLYSSWRSLMQREVMRRRIIEGWSASVEDLRRLERAARELQNLRTLIRWIPVLGVLPAVKNRVNRIELLGEQLDPNSEREEIEKLSKEMAALSVEEDRTLAEVTGLVESIRADDSRREREARRRRRYVAGGWLALAAGAGLNVVAAFMAVAPPAVDTGSVTVPTPPAQTASSNSSTTR